MDEAADFNSLLARVRAGDAQASADLLKHYESELRIIARVKLNDPRLRRVVDSMDVCQSVLANFFVRATAGQFDIETPEQLVNLLAVMIRNKVTDDARRQTADRRNLGRVADAEIEQLPLAANQDTPSQIVAAKELADLALKRFSPDEVQILERRKSGLGWDEIARDLGGSPEALRKKMTRAIDRVAENLGLGGTELNG